MGDLPAVAPADAPTRARAVVVALLLATLAACYSAGLIYFRLLPGSDFDQLWLGANVLWSGRNPYDVIGPGKEINWHWPLYYPATAFVGIGPLAWMEMYHARIAFAAIGAGALGYAVASRAPYLWPMFLSASFVASVAQSQPVPLLVAGALVPGFAVVWAMKPNLGLVLAAQLNWRAWGYALAGGAVLLGLSLVLEPRWLSGWHAAIQDSSHIVAAIDRVNLVPLALLMAIMRFWRPDARLLLAAAVVPLSPLGYEHLFLFLCCRKRWEAAALALLTHVTRYVVIFTTAPGESWVDFANRYGEWSLWLCYLPVFALVMWRWRKDKAPFVGWNSAR